MTIHLILFVALGTLFFGEISAREQIPGKTKHGVRILLMSKAVMVVYSAASGTTALRRKHDRTRDPS